MIKFSKCAPGAMCEGCISDSMPAVRTVTVAGGEEYRNVAAVVNLCAGCITGLGQVSAVVCQQLQDERKVGAH